MVGLAIIRLRVFAGVLGVLRPMVLGVLRAVGLGCGVVLLGVGGGVSLVDGVGLVYWRWVVGSLWAVVWSMGVYGARRTGFGVPVAFADTKKSTHNSVVSFVPPVVGSSWGWGTITSFFLFLLLQNVLGQEDSTNT